jgi:hypothetical protein
MPDIQACIERNNYMRLYGHYIKLPFKIITLKIQAKNDSIFYAGKHIAEFKVRDRTYILTTAGEYKFSYKDKRNKLQQGTEHSNVIKSWKDPHKHTYVEDAWGSFSIDVIEKGSDGKETCLHNPIYHYGEDDYNLAMIAFIEFVERDLQMKDLTDLLSHFSW